MVIVINIIYTTIQINVYTRLPPSYFFEVDVSNTKCGLWGFDNKHRPNHLNVLVDIYD